MQNFANELLICRVPQKNLEHGGEDTVQQIHCSQVWVTLL